MIPNFVDLERFHPDPDRGIRGQLRAGDRFVLTHVSNYRPVKRVEDVVRGFANLRAHLEAVLVLVGDGPDLSKAKDLARDLGVREDLRVLGKMMDLEKVYQASDLFFLPSLAESFGLSALEAQACGVPVIGYLAGGLPEVVKNGETGILCPAGQDICLGGVAAELLTDSRRYGEMRRASRENAESFSVGRILKRYESSLCGLVNGVDTDPRNGAVSG